MSKESVQRAAANKVLTTAMKRAHSLSNVAAGIREIDTPDRKEGEMRSELKLKPGATSAAAIAAIKKAFSGEDIQIKKGSADDRVIVIIKGLPTDKSAGTMSSKLKSALAGTGASVYNSIGPGKAKSASNVAAGGDIISKLEAWAGTKIKPGRNTLKGYPVDIDDQDPSGDLEMDAVDRAAATDLQKELRQAGFKTRRTGDLGILVSMSNTPVSASASFDWGPYARLKDLAEHFDSDGVNEDAVDEDPKVAAQLKVLVNNALAAMQKLDKYISSLM